MILNHIRTTITEADEPDPVALAIVYLADTLESALHEVAERLNDLGTSVENAGL